MRYLLLTIFCLLSFSVLGQVENSKLPYGYSKSLKNSPQKIVLPTIDIGPYMIEDIENEENDLKKPYRFGVKVPVAYNLFNSGSWAELENGDRVWRLNVKSPGARTINFLLDRFDVPQGAELYVYNASSTDHIGPYTSKQVNEDGFLGTWIVYGDDVWIEYYEPAEVRGLGRISIDTLVHGYRGFGQAEEDFLKLNESGACNVDVNCDPNVGSTNGQNWSTVRDNYRHAVARILINGNGLCTGTLVNNVQNNGTPYFLTANHCLGLGPSQDGFGSGYPASRWIFGFDWFATTGARCATFSNTSGPNQPTRTINGATLRANLYASDVALFELNNSPATAWNLYYAGWNRSTTPATSQLSMHHPSGDIMKLARNDQPVNFVTVSGIQCWNVADWDYGVTEGGSSGGCLIDQNGLIIGQLLGGGAACNGTRDNGQPDWYGRFDRSWNAGRNSRSRLRDWLDPNNTGVITMMGSFTNTLSTSQVDIQPSISVYPNPSNGVFTVNSDTEIGYKIFDIQGRLIQSGTTVSSNTVVDLQAKADGVYFIKFDSEAVRPIKLIKH